MTQIYNGLARFRRKPPVYETVHVGEPIDPLPHERRLAVSDLYPISQIISDHRAVMVERPAPQSSSASETRHDNGQSGATAIILSHPQPASVGNLAAEWWYRAFDNEARIDKVEPFGKP